MEGEPGEGLQGEPGEGNQRKGNQGRGTRGSELRQGILLGDLGRGPREGLTSLRGPGGLQERCPWNWVGGCSRGRVSRGLVHPTDSRVFDSSVLQYPVLERHNQRGTFFVRGTFSCPLHLVLCEHGKCMQLACTALARASLLPARTPPGPLRVSLTRARGPKTPVT